MKNQIKTFWSSCRFVSALIACTVICVLDSTPASAAGVTSSATSVTAAPGLLAELF